MFSMILQIVSSIRLRSRHSGLMVYSFSVIIFSSLVWLGLPFLISSVLNLLPLLVVACSWAITVSLHRDVLVLMDILLARWSDRMVVFLQYLAVMTLLVLPSVRRM